QGKIERWSIMPGAPPQQEGKIPRSHDPNVCDSYVLAPDGDLLARLSSFPTLSVLVYSYSTGNLKQTLPLQDDPNQSVTAEVFAFVSPSRLLVKRHTERNGIDGLEVWHSKANKKLKT